MCDRVNYCLTLKVYFMNFILEVLPKKENANQFVWIVRAQNGFPLAVCDSLENAKEVIEEKFNQSLAKPENS